MDQAIRDALIESTKLMITVNLRMNIERGHRTINSEEDRMTLLLDMHHNLFPPYVRNAFSAQQKGETLHPFVELIELYTEIWKQINIEEICPITSPQYDMTKN